MTIPLIGAGSSEVLPNTLDEISSKQIWVRADDSGPGLADGASVASWPNRGLLGGNFAEATNQPTFETNEQNGLPGLLFVGANSDVLGLAELNDWQAISAFLVARLIGAPNGGSVYGWGANCRVFSNGTDQGLGISGGAFAGSASALARISCIRGVPGGGFTQLNAGAPAAWTPNAAWWSAVLPTFMLGPTTILSCDFIVHELIVRDVNASQAMADRIIQLLNAKWAAF